MTVERSEHPSRQKISILVAASLTLPGVVLRLSAAHPEPVAGAALFGLSIVASAFLLSWAAEVAQLDISRGLALAALAFIAVLPEYAVDLVFSWKAGHDPSQAPLALANMTGANRLLIGVGWSMVVLLAAWRFKRVGIRSSEVALERSHSVEIAFLALATGYSLSIPFRRTLSLVDAAVLVSIFIAYLIRIARAPAEEPHLVGPAQLLGSLSVARRRAAVLGIFAFAAGVILACAEPFAEALVEAGESLGVDSFLLVQWLAPLASEAPELVIAGLFAWRLNSNAGLGALVSSKVNQWTLLVGTIPIVYAISSGSLHGLPIDGMQREELLLTAAQSLFAVAVILNRRLSMREALTLLGLFVVQFTLGVVLPEGIHDEVRIGTSIIYLFLAAGMLVANRGALPKLFRDGFRTPIEQLADPGFARGPAEAAGTPGSARAGEPQSGS